MNADLMKRCDEFLRKRVEERGFPQDFDDVTWAMHDFALIEISEERERAAMIAEKVGYFPRMPCGDYEATIHGTSILIAKNIRA